MRYYPKDPCPKCGKRGYDFIKEQGLLNDTEYFQGRECRSCRTTFRSIHSLVQKEDGYYTYIQNINRKSIPLHHLIWEWANGENLPPGTIVHHINGKKRDNRPCNLLAVLPGEHDRPHQIVIMLRKRIEKLEEEICRLKGKY